MGRFLRTQVPFADHHFDPDAERTRSAFLRPLSERRARCDHLHQRTLY